MYRKNSTEEIRKFIRSGKADRGGGRGGGIGV